MDKVFIIPNKTPCVYKNKYIEDNSLFVNNCEQLVIYHEKEKCYIQIFPELKIVRLEEKNICQQEDHQK